MAAAAMVCAAATAQIGHRGSANVTFAGEAADAAGKRVELYSYDDMLTMREVLEDSARIDSAGRFALSCYTNYPRLVYVQIESYTQSFFIEPGRDYRVYLPEFDWTVDERQNVYLAPVALPLEFLDLPADELNLRIGAFEHLVDSFVVANRVHLDPRFKPRRTTFDTLAGLVRSRFGAPGDDFFGRYVTYTMAQMQYDMRFASRKGMVSRYIADEPVRYHDEQYMRLFLGLYANSISHGTRRVPLERLVAWVAAADVDTYLDSIGLDPLLRNGQVRELAALEALKESYYMPDYDRDGVKAMVGGIASRSRFDEHRRLAGNLLRMWDVAAADSVAEAEAHIVLPDVDRRMVDLDSLRGKWLYIAFVRSGDPHSLAELETMAHFRDSIYASQHDVEFVSVCCDREFQKMYHLLRNSRRGHRYNWLWLHFDGDYRLLERYDVVSYPTFVLLDPEGRRVYEMTPSPATGFLLHGPWVKPEPQETEKDIFLR